MAGKPQAAGQPRRRSGGEADASGADDPAPGVVWLASMRRIVEDTVTGLTCLGICAGAGGQSLGLEHAGFAHEAVVELDPDACETLRLNRGSEWKIIECDVHDLDGQAFTGIDLFSGGLPCPPFSIAGKQLGEADERDLFPRALRLIKESSPRAVLLENVRGLAGHRFDGYRGQILQCLHDLGYRTWWDRVQASMHGVPQLRPRFVLVAIRDPWAAQFRWPATSPQPPPTVGDALHDLMSSRGWPGAQAWRTGADGIAPTIVRGSKKHGGPDLGPTRARQAWRKLQVDGLGIADDPPGPRFPARPDAQADPADGRPESRDSPTPGPSPAAKPPPAGRSATHSRRQWRPHWASRSATRWAAAPPPGTQPIPVRAPTQLFLPSPFLPPLTVGM